MSRFERYAHLAPVPLRLIWGIIFIAHGLPKLLNSAGTAGFFGNLGIPVPVVSAIVIGLVEVIGGLCVLVGIQVRLASALLALTMVGAIALAKFPMGFVGGWEFDLALLAGALSLMLSGATARSAK